MRRSLFTGAAALFGDLLSSREQVLADYKRNNGGMILGLCCDVIPLEVPAALGALPVRIPCPGRCCAEAPELSPVYDFVILPRGCPCAEKLAVRDRTILFPVPEGYGQEHTVALHQSLEGLLRETGLGATQDISQENLSRAAGEYNALRRTVRRVCAARNADPGLLSCDDLGLVLSAALCLPPGLVTGPLLDLAEKTTQEPRSERPRSVPALVHYSCGLPAGLLDAIEEEGVLVAEDDTCMGRRSFDLSFDAQSPDLYYEILDACSYRPLCPSVRPLEERHELLYKLAGTHGIGLVIFIEDECCGSRQRDIARLRVMLMRSGIDPLVVSAQDAVDRVRDYADKASR